MEQHSPRILGGLEVLQYCWYFPTSLPFPEKLHGEKCWKSLCAGWGRVCCCGGEAAGAGGAPRVGPCHGGCQGRESF